MLTKVNVLEQVAVRYIKAHKTLPFSDITTLKYFPWDQLYAMHLCGGSEETHWSVPITFTLSEVHGVRNEDVLFRLVKKRVDEAVEEVLDLLKEKEDADSIGECKIPPRCESPGVGDVDDGVL